jgi:hypothetical protein
MLNIQFSILISDLLSTPWLVLSPTTLLLTTSGWSVTTPTTALRLGWFGLMTNGSKLLSLTKPQNLRIVSENTDHGAKAGNVNLSIEN